MMSSKRVGFGMGVLCFILLLAACAQQSALPSATPCPTTQVNASPLTQTTGPVSIATDHSIYTPFAIVHVTIENHLGHPINMYGDLHGCELLDLQQLIGGAWKQVPLCSPHAGDELPDTPEVGISPSKTYQDILYYQEISAGQPAGQYVPFPIGTFRIVIQYIELQSTATSRQLAYSATFRICGCGGC